MNTRGITIVASKEFRELTMNKQTWVTSLLFAAFFAWSNSLTDVREGGMFPLDGKVLYLSLFVGAFTGFILCGAVFFREKQTGVIETLMCTPLSLREIWMGKVIGVAVPSYLISLLSVGIMLAFASSYTVLPSPSLVTVVQLCAVTPLLTAAAIGMVGYMQMAMGMRENRVLGMVVFVLLFAGLSVTTAVVIQDGAVIAEVVAVLLVASIALLLGAFALSRRLSKEKIVTTIPD